MTEPRSNGPSRSTASARHSLETEGVRHMHRWNTDKTGRFQELKTVTGLEDEVRFNKAYGGIQREGCLAGGCVLIICMKSPGLSPYKANGKPKQSWLWGSFTGNDTENGLLMLGGQVRHMTHNSAGWAEKLRVSARTVRKGSSRASL